MEFTISKMKTPLVVIENKKQYKLNGYAFINSVGGCIIIVYGEGRRDSMAKHLKGDTNEFSLKYNIVDLKKK